MKPRTISDYRNETRRYIKPHLGDVKLTKLTPLHLERLCRTLMAEGGQNGRPLSPKTVLRVHRVIRILIGPNNEGKSNILRGLVTGMRLLAGTPGASRRPRQTGAATRYRVVNDDYNWDRDFPIGLQAAKPDGTTVFDFTFELSDDEISEFQTEVKSKLNGTLPIRLTAGQDTLTFEVRKKGPGGKALTDKRTAIADFVATRLNPQDIPAIRTAQASMRGTRSAQESTGLVWRRQRSGMSSSAVAWASGLFPVTTSRVVLAELAKHVGRDEGHTGGGDWVAPEAFALRVVDNRTRPR